MIVKQVWYTRRYEDGALRKKIVADALRHGGIRILWLLVLWKKWDCRMKLTQDTNNVPSVKKERMAEPLESEIWRVATSKTSNRSHERIQHKYVDSWVRCNITAEQAMRYEQQQADRAHDGWHTFLSASFDASSLALYILVFIPFRCRTHQFAGWYYKHVSHIPGF